MRGFRSAVEQTRRFTTHAFQEGRKVLGHIDRGMTTAGHIYHHVAPMLAPLAVHAMGAEKAQLTHNAVSGGFAGYGRVREKALQADRMLGALQHATKKRTVNI